MVDWKPDAPVDEFWEAWNNAAQEVAALQSENDDLRAQLADMKLKYNLIRGNSHDETNKPNHTMPEL